MRRVTEVLPAGSWLAKRQTATVTLPCTERHRRRIVMRDDAGAEFLLDLREAVHLADGDGLALEDGGVVRVTAAEEFVAEARCTDPLHLARVAWHLGNRHQPVQMLADGGIRFPHDHVIEAMVAGLGAEVSHCRAPFQPERGAYAGGGESGGHSHSHGHGHGHAHAH